MTNPLLAPTKLLDFDAAPLAHLIESRSWRDLSEYDRIGAAYDFVRNEISFGYNRADDIPASEVLSDGYGQCNTKGTLLMALLRGVGVRCRLHGFTIHKGLQRGVVPELVYPLAPEEILHSWVEIEFQGAWINLEGFILDDAFFEVLQRSFSDTDSLCGYGAGTDCLGAPPVAWNG
ncbi:MAG TPA: transglutaminase family protein, partial [Alphaproteobacteria bacterium]|nr:transglutaminase family protein [Alphaproteobacteria bacterium]